MGGRVKSNSSWSSIACKSVWMHHFRIVFIVRDEDPRNPELADDALLDEATNIFLCNGC